MNMSRITRDRVGRFAQYKEKSILTNKIFLFLCACTALLGLSIDHDIKVQEAEAMEKMQITEQRKADGYFCLSLNGKGVDGLPSCEEYYENKYKEQPIEYKIRLQARKWGVDENRAVKIAYCESRFDPKAEHNVSTASGIFQFTRPTWADGIKWRGLDWKLSDRFDEDKNIEMAMWFMKRGEWKRWACDDLIH